jgi:hypothetical protein
MVGDTELLAWMAAGIKTADPTPLVHVDRTTGPAWDRADLDVAVIDAPAVGALRIAAAGEGGQRRVRMAGGRMTPCRTSEPAAG